MVRRFVLPFIASIPDTELRSLFLELKNTPGALTSALNVISAADLKVLGIVSNIAMNIDQTLHVLIFIDVNGYTEDQLNFFIKLIAKKKGVKRIRMHKQYPPHTSIAPFYDQLGVYDLRAVILTDSELRGLLHDIYAKLGKSSAEALLYHLGQPMGASDARYIKKIFVEMGKTEPIEIIPLISLGWCGHIDIEQTDEGTYKIKVKELIECQLLKERIFEPASQLIRGFLAGYISEITGGEWDVIEVECVASGSELCMFVAKRRTGSAAAGI